MFFYQFFLKKEIEIEREKQKNRKIENFDITKEKIELTSNQVFLGEFLANVDIIHTSGFSCLSKWQYPLITYKMIFVFILFTFRIIAYLITQPFFIIKLIEILSGDLGITTSDRKQDILLFLFCFLKKKLFITLLYSNLSDLPHLMKLLPVLILEYFCSINLALKIQNFFKKKELNQTWNFELNIITKPFSSCQKENSEISKFSGAFKFFFL